MAEWLRRWTANPLGSARVGSNPVFVAPPHWFYGVMVSTLDFESSDPSSNLGRTFPFFPSSKYSFSTQWLRGATVARLTPDQKAACSNHVGVRNILSDGGMQRREDSQWSKSTRNGKISVINKLKQYIFSTAVLSPQQTKILWKVLRFQENNVASNEDWTHDLWFTRPTLCHWAIEACGHLLLEIF